MHDHDDFYLIDFDAKQSFLIYIQLSLYTERQKKLITSSE